MLHRLCLTVGPCPPVPDFKDFKICICFYTVVLDRYKMHFCSLEVTFLNILEIYFGHKSIANKIEQCSRKLNVSNIYVQYEQTVHEQTYRNMFQQSFMKIHVMNSNIYPLPPCTKILLFNLNVNFKNFKFLREYENLHVFHLTANRHFFECK